MTAYRIESDLTPQGRRSVIRWGDDERWTLVVFRGPDAQYNAEAFVALMKLAEDLPPAKWNDPTP